VAEFGSLGDSITIMNTRVTEQSETRKTKQIVDSFFHRHRLYFVGILTGFGFGVFAFEAFQRGKEPLIYIGSLFLCGLGGTLYRSFK
jgi:hypothetical protein